ncbi:hypothetical protein Tco_1122682 [Tanacetum coccineum]|uniref:Uncharacterized protein n=1 Tax=Tanacetum coccineum TaxID=301880 RepID=A0ABQ5J184_9ASTR
MGNLALLNVESMIVKLRQIRSLGNLTFGARAKTVLSLRPQRIQLVMSKSKRRYYCVKATSKRSSDPRLEGLVLLLVQGKVTNLNVEERIAFNVSLRMFTRSVVIQRRVEDL